MSLHALKTGDTMKNIIVLVLSILLMFLATYIIQPVLNFHFIGWLIYPLIIGLSIALLGLLQGSFEKKVTKRIVASGLAVIILSLLFLLVASVASSPMINWRTKQSMLAINEVSFDESVPNVDMENLIILDEFDAIRFSEQLITKTDPAMGSMYSISERFGTISVINGQPFWLFPLEHNGFFKWKRNGVIPGYIKVNATTGDSEFVETTIKYAPSSYFSDDLHRRIYSEYKNVGLTDISFEVDNDGKPYWVITAYTHKTLVSTTDVVGSIVVDPLTGDLEYYAVDEQPEWIDRIFSVSIFNEQLDNWGKYVNGWWNPSDTGKLRDTDGKGYVFKDDNLFFYTGITSYGGDEATTGFMIFNPRTGQAHYNRISGSTETKAIGLMEELVQNAGYTANYPYLLNLNGEATYFSTLSGNSGNVVGYAFASVKNYKAVAWGKTLREAQTNYSRALVREGSTTNQLADQSDKLKSVKGLVSRVGALSEGYYVVKFEGIDSIFTVSTDQYPMVALTNTTDEVEIKYIETDETLKIDAIVFKNLSIK